jgi:deoxyribonuclease-4
MLYGSHLSIAGGMINALTEADRLGMDTVQVFTKNQRQWKFKPLDEGDKAAWLTKLAELGWEDRTVSHDSYLINLASPNDELWEKSIVTMREEIERCEALKIRHLVSHPGAHMKEGVEEGCRKIARAYKRVFKETRGYETVVCLENTAGGGTTLGRTFEELAMLMEMIGEEAGDDADGRVGFCFDTCHALAAGYDLASHANGDGTGKKRTKAQAEELADGVLDEFDAVCGLEHMRVLHMNDSVGGRGSRRDRHAHIGEANVAMGAFSAVVNRAELAGRPMILETPKGEDEKGRENDTVNLNKLKKLVRAGAGAGV